jgi:hypothetical protein
LLKHFCAGFCGNMFSISLGTYFVVQLQGGKLMFNFKKWPKCLPKELYYCAFPPAIHEFLLLHSRVRIWCKWSVILTVLISMLRHLLILVLNSPSNIIFNILHIGICDLVSSFYNFFRY